MLERLLRYASIFCSVAIALGWVLFAVDETREASNASATQSAGQEAARSVDPTPEQERDRERAHSGVREAVDDVNDVLLAPFGPLVEDSDSQWVRRTVPAALGMLLYGFGLAFLGRFTRGRA